MSAPPWRVALAALLLVVLTAAVLHFALGDGEPTSSGSTPAVATTEVPTTSSGGASPVTREPMITAAPVGPEVAAAEAALAAWGRFAVTGDLTLLDGVFDRAGPQYQQATSEAPDAKATTSARPPMCSPWSTLR